MRRARPRLPLGSPTVLDVIDHAIEIDFGSGGIWAAARIRRPPTATMNWTSNCRAVTTAVHHFYRLLGDVDGDGIVDANDLNEIAASVSETSPMGWTALLADVTGAGTVTALDLTLATRSKGRALLGKGSRWDKPATNANRGE